MIWPESCFQLTLTFFLKLMTACAVKVRTGLTSCADPEGG